MAEVKKEVVDFNDMEPAWLKMSPESIRQMAQHYHESYFALRRANTASWQEWREADQKLRDEIYDLQIQIALKDAVIDEYRLMFKQEVANG